MIFKFKQYLYLVLILLQLVLQTHISYAQQIRRVSATEYGALPDHTALNTALVVKKILISQKPNEVLEINFPKGRYDFFPDSSSKSVKAFELVGKKNITIKGNGSTFIFHGKMSPFYIEDCANIKLLDFNVDWQRPYSSQAEIVTVTPTYLIMKIDQDKYPYSINEGIISFQGEGWNSGVELHNLYEKNSKDIVYRTNDNPLGNDFFKARAVEIAPGLIQFFAQAVYMPTPGMIVGLLHARYLSPAIQLLKSKDMQLQNINIYHSIGMGVLGFKTENIRLDSVNVRTDEKSDRVFSAIADGFHFTSCKGSIKITNCMHTGQADDFLNVHGDYVPIKSITGDNMLIAQTNARIKKVKELIAIGDELSFVNKETGEGSPPYLVIGMDEIIEQQKVMGYALRFDKKLPQGLTTDFYLENITWYPEVEIRDCKVLKKNRARGLLISTPKSVLIENNFFNTAGAAILIEGDLNYWYESGGVRKVTIRKNTFENCVTSGQYWGEAIINISPSFKPANEQTIPYHQGIRIEDNLFKHFDQLLVSATSVSDLIFKRNKIILTKAYQPFSMPFGFYFNGCKKVSLSGNQFSSDFEGKQIRIAHMATTDINLKNLELRILSP